LVQQLSRDAERPAWPARSSTVELRVFRGGSWNVFAEQLRIAYRGLNSPASATPYFGFRCVRAFDTRNQKPNYEQENSPELTLLASALLAAMAGCSKPESARPTLDGHWIGFDVAQPNVQLIADFKAGNSSIGMPNPTSWAAGPSP